MARYIKVHVPRRSPSADTFFFAHDEAEARAYARYAADEETTAGVVRILKVTEEFVGSVAPRRAAPAPSAA